MVKRFFDYLLFPGFLAVTACAATSLTPFGKEEIFQLHEDEKRLWRMAEEEEKRIDRRGVLYENPGLLVYVEGIVQRLIPDDVKGKGVSFRVKVVQSPLLNAFALPNGVVYIHTGFLAKMENEAQLATVLAHEITHVTHRHAVQGFRNMKDTAAFMATLQVTAAPAGMYGLAPLLLGTVGAMAAVSGYSKELEAEADRVGLELLVKGGYDPKEAVRLFEHVQKYLEEEEIKEPFFFGTHPRLQERRNSYNQLLRSFYAGHRGEKGADGFMKMLHPVFLDNAVMDLSMGRFNLAKGSIDRFLKNEPQSAKAHYYLGELYRKRAEVSDVEKAEKEYQLSMQYDPFYPEPHKGLGLIYMKQGQKEKAKENLEKYLLLAPQTEDKGYIEQYLKEMAGG